VELSSDNIPTLIPHDASLCLFRVAEEAMNNALKHSGSSKIRVELAGDSSCARLRTSDSGRGFESGAMENTEGLGLLSMREPLRLVGDELSIQSRPNGGTQVEARIPFFLWAANIIQ